MPSHYLYVCGNGHEEMRYRNSSRCRKCGLPILRKDAPLPDKELQSLRAQNAALLAEVERLQRERSEWCDQADRRLTEQMTQQRDLLAENERLLDKIAGLEYETELAIKDKCAWLAEVKRLRARLTLTPEKVEAAAIAMWKFDDSPAAWDSAYEDERSDYLRLARAALLAAGMEEEQ